jgi:hypothetical protein
MASLLFQGHFATGLQEDEAQETSRPIRDDGPAENSSPEWNAVKSDESGEVIGLAERNLSSKTHPSTRGIYSDQGYYGIELASAAHNILIDQQVSNSGTAAHREQTGERGHGSIWWEEGIEPLNPAQRYGNDYFVRDSLAANEGSGNYMTPAENDNYPQQYLQTTAQNAARAAHMATQYGNYFGGPSVDTSKRQAFSTFGYQQSKGANTHFAKDDH